MRILKSLEVLCIMEFQLPVGDPEGGGEDPPTSKKRKGERERERERERGIDSPTARKSDAFT